MLMLYFHPLAYRLKGTGVESFAAHPGIARTDLFRKADHEKMASVVTDWAQWLSGQKAENGALSLLYCATAPKLEGKAKQQNILEGGSDNCVCEFYIGNLLA